LIPLAAPALYSRPRTTHSSPTSKCWLSPC
jgi:hypothetical protein